MTFNRIRVTQNEDDINIHVMIVMKDIQKEFQQCIFDDDQHLGDILLCTSYKYNKFLYKALYCI